MGRERIYREVVHLLNLRETKGDLDRANNDAGIVFTPKGDHVVVAFCNGNTADETEYMANNSIRSGEPLSLVSKAVYAVYMED